MTKTAFADPEDERPDDESDDESKDEASTGANAPSGVIRTSDFRNR
jgi:hypothetical protein